MPRELRRVAWREHVTLDKGRYGQREAGKVLAGTHERAGVLIDADEARRAQGGRAYEQAAGAYARIQHARIYRDARPIRHQECNLWLHRRQCGVLAVLEGKASKPAAITPPPTGEAGCAEARCRPDGQTPSRRNTATALTKHHPRAGFLLWHCCCRSAAMPPPPPPLLLLPLLLLLLTSACCLAQCCCSSAWSSTPRILP